MLSPAYQDAFPLPVKQFMPLELDLFGALVPALLPIFGGTVLLYLILDKWSSRWDWDRWVWHPALFRLSLFVIVFALLALGVYA